jgi:predicted CoA-binding protein
MQPLHYNDSHIAGILQRTKTIAMVGASPKPNRASHMVMKFLQEYGYRIIPVNIQTNIRRIRGEKVYASLSLIPDSYQLVDIFRNVDHALQITKETVALSKLKKMKQYGCNLTFEAPPLQILQKKLV